MECKYDIGDTWNQENGVLIETLWNVKDGLYNGSVWCETVLIETLWNVKAGAYCRIWDCKRVLIETLWNVKSGEGLGNSERAEWLFLGIYGNWRR